MTSNQQEDSTLHPTDHRNAAKIATWLTRRDITTGEMAGLRKLDPGRPTESAFWKVYGQLGIDESSSDLVRYWAIVFRIIAAGTKVGEAQTDGPHDDNLPLGKALAQAGYSHNRLKTLLDADANALLPIVERMAGFLHSKGQKFNCNDAARLVMTKYRSPGEQDYDRTRIARDYYRQLKQQGRP